MLVRGVFRPQFDGLDARIGAGKPQGEFAEAIHRYRPGRARLAPPREKGEPLAGYVNGKALLTDGEIMII